jgi:ribosomal protein L11 methyltransferase
MILENIQILQSGIHYCPIKLQEIEQVNWNEEWEKNFEPIDVDGKVSCTCTFSY